MSKKLLSCPFCGGEAKATENYLHDDYTSMDGFIVFCIKCGCSTDTHCLKKDAIAAWNRRAESTNKPLNLEQLRTMSGQPVWTKDLVCPKIECLRFDKEVPAIYHSGNDFRFEQFGTDMGFIRWEVKYGITWLAYRCQPEGVDQK